MKLAIWLSTLLLAITYVQIPKWVKQAHLDIYVWKKFQWYNELFNLISFDPCNRSLKIQESIGSPTPKLRAHLGVWGFIFTFPYTPGSTKCESWASFLAHTFVNPCLDHEPKARVVTLPSPTSIHLIFWTSFVW